MIWLLHHRIMNMQLNFIMIAERMEYKVLKLTI